MTDVYVSNDHEEVLEVLQVVLNGSLKRSKSNIVRIDSIQEDKQGHIAIFKTKSLMQQGIGEPIKTVTGLEKVVNQASHWTPNPYYRIDYVGQRRIAGFQEEKLQRINTFVVDLDFPSSDDKPSAGELEQCLFTEGFVPTVILDTPKGYHVYFVLEKPCYISKKNGFKSLNTAKAISTSLKLMIANHYPEAVDLNCNDFGIFRMPQKENIVHFEPNAAYEFKQLMKWSIQVQKELKKTRNKARRNLKVINNFRQIETPWYSKIMNAKSIDSQINSGRNNTIFTLALANKQSGTSLGDCLETLLAFNQQLSNPLSQLEVEKTIKSAYSGRFQAAHSDYISSILEGLGYKVKPSDMTKIRVFNKNRKKREDRVYSHSEEWEKDLLMYLDGEVETYKQAVFTTKQTISEETGIPLRSLDRLIKRLTAENKIVSKQKRGRGGGIMLASVKAIIESIIASKGKSKEVLFAFISEFANSPFVMIKEILSKIKQATDRAGTMNSTRSDSG